MAIETELKLQLPDEGHVQDPHAAIQRLQPGIRVRGAAQRLHSVYYDTPEHDLAKRGMALRVRDYGRRKVQTLKAPVRGKAGLQMFREFEAEVPTGEPSLSAIGSRTVMNELRREIWPHLLPLFQTEIERTVWRLPFRGSEIEVAWDRGRIRAGDREVPVHEYELELKSGDRNALFDAAEELLDVVPYRLGHATKAARGYALAAGIGAAPCKSAAPDLSAEDTVAVAFEKIVAGCLEQMQANERAILGGADIEAIHQFRVALRRLRAIVGVCRELIEDGTHAIWSIDLRWAQRACGPARDYDVLVSETLTRIQQHVPGDEGFRRFLEIAGDARSAARREAVRTLNNPRYAAMQLQIYRALGSGAWRRPSAAFVLDGPVRGFAEGLLQARYRRLRRLGDRWDELEASGLHRLRILGKKLRYVALAFCTLFKAKPANRFLARLSDIQDCLGVLNDGLVGRQLTAEIAELARAGDLLQAPELQRIRGMIDGWHAHAVHDRIGEFQKVWEEFAAAKRFWRT